MVQKLLISFLFLCGILFGQKKTSPIFIGHNSIKDSIQVEYISYRIPFNQLLFIKNGKGYKASFTFAFEFYKDKKFVEREISKKEVFTNDYNNTKSNEIFFEDFISIVLTPNNYLVKSTLAIDATELDIALPELKIQVHNLEKEIINPPIVINSKTINDSGREVFKLTNLQNQIPFSPKKYNLLLGIKDTSIENISIEIKQNDKHILKRTLSKSFRRNITIEKDDKVINLELGKKSLTTRCFLLDDFNHLLEEGEIELTIKADTSERKFSLNVFWLNKPKVLYNPEYSIKLLSFVEDVDNVKDLLKGSEKDYYKNLFNYWKDHYPTKIKYNYAINEYYSRADYAIKHFKSLKSKKGAESDRGKIYITYGKPSSIDRTYNEKNEIVEIWDYSKISRTFIFKDISGTGKYILTK